VGYKPTFIIHLEQHIILALVEIIFKINFSTDHYCSFTITLIYEKGEGEEEGGGGLRYAQGEERRE
jgi:hypothetical protein